MSSRVVGLPLEGAASEVLRGYVAEGRCVLAQSGYLDLSGNVWASVVEGDGWVEVTVVRQLGESESEVTVVRMDADVWERELGDVMGGEP